MNFPNDDKISSPFRIDAFIAAANPVSVSGQGKVTLGAGPLDFDAITEIKGIELADFTYLFPNTKVSVASGQASAKVVSQCRRNYVESNQHVEIKGLKLAGKGGFLGKMVLGMPSGAVVKFLEDKQGFMVFDFKVSGEINNLKANPKEIIGAAFTRSFREKFSGSILDVGQEIRQGVDQGVKQGVQNIGGGLKGIFNK